ncbi:hypothetical protein BDR07DRAFT_1379273 [Suillus spraguei]|nr:hypothetical protein BDR07DRAFT_1379273 [Suillus spraguei]
MATSALLVLAGGVFAGLSIGLMGLDELHLRVLATSSAENMERTNAQIVLNLMQRGRHWVLVVLLLSNVIINESLPIFLDSAIGGGLLAIVISATAIGPTDRTVLSYIWRVSTMRRAPWGGFDLLAKRVIPQAVCARYGLAIGARCAPFVLLLMYLFAPVAYPIAKILDRALGVHDAHTYKKAELKSFLQFHRTGQEPLRDDEIGILNGVLELSSKNVETIMTPIHITAFVFAEAHSHLFSLTSGYSRFPVHQPGNPLAFEGLLLIKKLLIYDPARGLPVSHFPLSILPEALPSINCFQALDYFRTPGSPGGGIGVITLEDVIEEIISEEIVDETDQYEDNQSKRHAKRVIDTTVMRDIVEQERSIFTRTSTIEPTQVTSVNIEAMPLLPKSSLDNYPQAYRYVYHSIGES